MDINKKPKILVLDNYDSFTYNLVHQLTYLGLEEHTDIYRNNKITVKEAGKYDKILVSPGPGLPKESGITMDLIREYANSKSILGVCLGHQAIAEVFGGEIYNLDKVFHGITHKVKIVDESSAIFKGLENGFEACRYHSWSVVKDKLPDVLRITAIDDSGRIMALEHKSLPIFGVQFHPEAYTTKVGLKIVDNWVKLPFN